MYSTFGATSAFVLDHGCDEINYCFKFGEYSNDISNMRMFYYGGYESCIFWHWNTEFCVFVPTKQRIEFSKEQMLYTLCRLIEKM